MTRREPWGIALALTAASIVIANLILLAQRHGDDLVVAGPTPSTTAAQAPQQPTTTVVNTTTTSTTVPPMATSTTSTTITGVTLRQGARGAQVLALERALDGLGYWLGTPDDVFDSSTHHAVVAFQKLHALARDGTAGPRVQAALATAARPVPRSAGSRVIEVDIGNQVVIVAEAGRAVAVLDASTGRVPGTTPTGQFVVSREVDGYDRGPLGVLYRPKYFFKGVSMHGYPSVPTYPASHGCVRVTNAAMDWLWATNAVPIGVAVWVYR